MKQLFLLFAAGSIAMNVGAQERMPSTANNGRSTQEQTISRAGRIELNKTVQHAGARKTTGPGGTRWYNYGQAMDTSMNYEHCTVLAEGDAAYYAYTSLGSNTIWNDTNGTVLYTGPVYSHVSDVSQASVLDPTAAIFNTDKDLAYDGLIRITSGDAYRVDSVVLFGVYSFNKTKTTFVDTIRLSFVTGDGSNTSDIFSGYSMAGGHYNAKTFYDVVWDSVYNTISTRTFTRPYLKDIYLNNAGGSPAWGDTNVNGIYVRTVDVNGSTGIAVPAGSYIAMSLTFISGDPATKTGALSSPTPGDTLLSTFTGIGNNRYNVWRPLCNYYTLNTGAADWAPYQCPTWEPTATDNNLGYWKRLPNTPANWDDTYLPTWAWSTGGGASSRQYPYMTWNVTCTSCNTITSAVLATNDVNAKNTVTTTPNPATNVLNVNYTLVKSGDVSVTLTNVVGQVVATQNISNTTNGTATFNTSALPSGVYVFALSANGEKTTGRVVVAH